MGATESQPAAAEPVHGPGGFRPPSAQQVQRLLERHGPVQPQRWVGLAFLGGIGAAVVLAAAVPNALTVVLPWLVIGGMIGYTSLRLSQHRKGARLNQQAQEMSLLREYQQALRLLWKVLPRVVRRPGEHSKAVGMLAHDLDAIGCHDAAIVAYDYLIDRMADEHPGRVELRLRKAICLLSENRLADADDALRGARNAVARHEAPPLDAWMAYAKLLQDIQTNHDADAVADAAESEQGFVDRLRPLGMLAAYPHALLSLAGHRWIARRARLEHERPGQTPLEENSGLSPEHVRGLAERAWHRATLLMPAEALVSRHPELGRIKLPGAPRPRLSLSAAGRGGEA